MTHKKMKHIENVSLCWHFSNGECPFGDETCWFKHEINKQKMTISQNLNQLNVIFVEIL